MPQYCFVFGGKHCLFIAQNLDFIGFVHVHAVVTLAPTAKATLMGGF